MAADSCLFCQIIPSVKTILTFLGILITCCVWILLLKPKLLPFKSFVLRLFNLIWQPFLFLQTLQVPLTSVTEMKSQSWPAPPYRLLMTYQFKTKALNNSLDFSQTPYFSTPLRNLGGTISNVFFLDLKTTTSNQSFWSDFNQGLRNFFFLPKLRYLSCCWLLQQKTYFE